MTKTIWKSPEVCVCRGLWHASCAAGYSKITEAYDISPVVSSGTHYLNRISDRNGRLTWKPAVPSGSSSLPLQLPSVPDMQSAMQLRCGNTGYWSATESHVALSVIAQVR